LKRTRSFEDIPSIPHRFEESRDIAGSNSVAGVTQDIEQLQVASGEIERLLFLPLHTEDLGRLPVYEPFDFDSIFNTDPFLESDTYGDNPFAASLDTPLTDSQLTTELFENKCVARKPVTVAVYFSHFLLVGIGVPISQTIPADLFGQNLQYHITFRILGSSIQKCSCCVSTSAYRQDNGSSPTSCGGWPSRD
jgi:hypothetical protein